MAAVRETQRMRPDDLLNQLFLPLPDADVTVDVRSFLAECGPAPAGVDEGPTHFARLVRVARHAPRRSLASVAGHQAAIRRLFPATPDDAVVAFCVSEDKGPRPAHILTSLEADGDGWRMNGTKRWGSMAPVADVRYVAASIGFEGDRNQLRMIALPADRPGTTIDLEPYRDWGPEFQICDLQFDDVEVRADEVIPGDAYLESIKPFRLVEDVYNTAGTLIGLFQLGRRSGWSGETLEPLVGLIVQAAAIAETDMASPSSVVLLSDFLERAELAWHATWSGAPAVDDGVVDDWQPERGLLGVAAAARATRRNTAWTQLLA